MKTTQESVNFVSASEFAKTHSCDPDWIAAMGPKTVPIFRTGQRGMTSGYEATVIRHAANGMYDVRVPGGSICIDWNDFEFEGKVETFGHENLKHPYADYSLADAVRLANGRQALGFEPTATSLIECRNIVEDMFTKVTHTWITGYCALDVLDAAIDGRDLDTDNRIVGSERDMERPKG